MPQLTLEYSANILEKSHLTSLLKSCHELIANELPTKIESCKSRAIERDIYCVGDGNAQNAFVHVVLKVMPGRDEATRIKVGEKLLELLKMHFGKSLEMLKLQITIELDELSTTYFKAAS